VPRGQSNLGKAKYSSILYVYPDEALSETACWSIVDGLPPSFISGLGYSSLFDVGRLPIFELPEIGKTALAIYQYGVCICGEMARSTCSNM
jgi:hypothetical protein